MSDLALSTSATPRRFTAAAVTPATPDRASATVWIAVMAAMIIVRAVIVMRMRAVSIVPVVIAGSVMIVVRRRVVETLRAMEGHEHETEAVERRHEHAEQHTPIRVRVSPTMRLTHCIDDRVLRIEAREERRTNQRQ